ncbi:MAG: LacI family DNA-binding transcriptional regulator [Bacteroidota bacterium]
MANGKTTIYDIAKRLQVTPSTVSRALSNHPRISSKTKKAVQEMASQLNYRHNNIAAALRSGHTHLLGVILPKVNRHFFSSVVKGIEQVAREAGYNVMITQSYDDTATERSNISAMLQSQVDGIIASIATETTEFAHFQRVINENIPLVLFDRVMEISDVSTVVIDDYQGAYKAVSHLIGQGCRRIAHLTGEPHLNIYKYRLRGYRDALEDHGLPYLEEMVIKSQVQLEDGRAGMEQLLALAERPDAVFASSDYAAMGAMQVLKERNLKIPEEMALVGFMNEPFTAFVEPGLTSVDQMSEEMGRFAAEIFLEQVQAKGKAFVPRKTVLTPELIIRGSSRKAQ